MPKPEENGSMDILQDPDFQRKSWKVQRAGWWLMLALAFAALAGLFGGGPLSRAEAGEPAAGFAIHYERFTRLYAPQTLMVEVSPAWMESDSTARIWFDRDWIESNHLTEITPAPASSSLDGDRLIYSFKARRSTTPLRVRFHLETNAMGRLRGSAGVVGGTPVSFVQFAYP